MKLEELNIPCHFSGVWHDAKTRTSADFKICILHVDEEENSFIGFVFDQIGLASLEGTFFKNKTIFRKNYIKLSSKKGDVSKTLVLKYQIDENIFELERGLEYEGEWGYEDFYSPEVFVIEKKMKKRFYTEEVYKESEGEEN